MPTNRTSHGRKKQKTGSTSSTKQTVGVLLRPLDNVDVAAKVFPFLEVRELMNLVSCRKDYHRYLTYPLVVRSALVTGGPCKASIETLVSKLRHGKICARDPLWVLRWALHKKVSHSCPQFPSRDGFYPENSIDPNSRAVLDAFRGNLPDAVEREGWKRGSVDGVLRRLADLLGDDHPCREHVLCHRDWYDLTHKYIFRNKCVDATLACVLDLRNPGSITPERLVEASRELKEHYDEYQRQLHIKECLHFVAPEVGCHPLILAIGWGCPEKRYVHYKKDIDSVLEPFLVNRDDDCQPAVIAEAMCKAFKKARVSLEF